MESCPSFVLESEFLDKNEMEQVQTNPSFLYCNLQGRQGLYNLGKTDFFAQMCLSWIILPFSMTLSSHVSDHELPLLSGLMKKEATIDLLFHTFFMESPSVILTLPIPPCLGGPQLCKQAVLIKTNTNVFHGTLTADYFYNLGHLASDSFSFTAQSGIWSLTTDGYPT